MEMRMSVHDLARNVMSFVTLSLTAAKREGKLEQSTLWNSDRRQLLKELRAILRLDHENNVRERDRIISGMEEDEIGEYESVYSVQKDYDKVWGLVKLFDTQTLRLILEKYGDGNHVGMIYWLNRFSGTEECLLREFISYDKCLRGNHGERKRYLMDARFVLPYEDLSELTGSERQRAEVLIKLSRALYFEVFSAFSDLVTGMDSYCRFAGNPIAVVAFEYPDRIDDIARYVGERKVFPSEVNCDHLREWLNTASRPLSAGVL